MHVYPHVVRAQAHVLLALAEESPDRATDLVKREWENSRFHNLHIQLAALRTASSSTRLHNAIYFQHANAVPMHVLGARCQSDIGHDLVHAMVLHAQRAKQLLTQFVASSAAAKVSAEATRESRWLEGLST